MRTRLEIAAPADMGAKEKPAPAKRTLDWRYVTGTFQVKIPVSTREVILPAEEDTLAILKWRLQATAKDSRWWPVLDRYVDYLSARVNGLGGDADDVEPSPTGAHASGRRGRRGEREYTGKVIGLLYDRFGDFTGFTLRLEDGHQRKFRGREHEIERLVHTAWLHRTVISVFVEPSADEWPAWIMLRQPPSEA